LFEAAVGPAATGTGTCPPYAYFLGAMGASLGLVFANIGASYGIAVSFFGYIELAKSAKDRLMLIKGLVPAIMASVRGVYGLIISILVTVDFKDGAYPPYKAFAHLFAGLCVGLSGFASGYCMGIVGCEGMKAVAKKPVIYMSILLIIIFAEAIGLYGLIIALILITNGNTGTC